MSNSTTQKRITVDQVKTAAFASEETLCFRARVLLDGVPFGEAHNDGHGGSTDVQLLTRGKSDPRTIHDLRLLMEEAVRYVAELPEIVTSFKDPEKPGDTFTYRETLGDLCEALAGEFEFQQKLMRSFKRDMKNKVMYSEGGALYEYKIPATELAARVLKFDKIRKHRPDALILNEMPPAEAFEVYRAHVVVKDI